MIIIRDVPLFLINFMATIIMAKIRLSMIPPPTTPPTIAGMLNRLSKGTKGVCVCVCGSFAS